MKITNGAKCTNDKIKDENNGVSATSAERFYAEFQSLKIILIINTTAVSRF